MTRLLVVAALVVAAGCGSKGTSKSATPGSVTERPDSAPTVPPVQTGPGETERYPQEGPREILWTARWKEGKVKLGERRLESAAFVMVDGRIMDSGTEKARYRADKGRSDEGSDVLALEKNVQVDALRPPGRLTCDRLEYHPSRKALRATGAIRYRGEVASAEVDGELWFSDDLTRMGRASFFPVLKTR